MMAFSIATLPWLLAFASLPNAIAEMELPVAPKPNAIAASAVAFALIPIAVAPVPGAAVEPDPQASSPLPAF